MRTNTDTNRVRRERPPDRQSTDLLIVGTLGGGGIHHYLDELAERLSSDLS